jgi:hypothetical protein
MNKDNLILIIAPPNFVIEAWFSAKENSDQFYQNYSGLYKMFKTLA